jgi:hypothetical protein
LVHNVTAAEAGMSKARGKKAKWPAAASEAGRLLDGPTAWARPSSTVRSRQPDFLATGCQALGIDFRREILTPIGWPVRLVDKAATPIAEVFTG